MSSKQRRVAAMHMKDYSAAMARPVRAVITYGGGLKIQTWIAEAEAQGYFVCMTRECVELR